MTPELKKKVQTALARVNSGTLVTREKDGNWYAYSRNKKERYWVAVSDEDAETEARKVAPDLF